MNIKKRFLESANQVFDNHAKVEETHYPERYYQDKDNPQIYKDFKDHYFKQKFQALTTVNAAESQIAKSQAELSKLPLDNLSGVQKQIRKLNRLILKRMKRLNKKQQITMKLYLQRKVLKTYMIFISHKEMLFKR